MYRHHFGLRHPPLRKGSTELCGSAAPLAVILDSSVLHRPKPQMRADGTVSYDRRFFEAHVDVAGKRLWLVVDPYTRIAIAVVDDDGKTLDGGPINPNPTTTDKTGSEDK
jgi:hypothetical protein